MKKIWTSFIFLFASVALLIGTTFAWFSSAQDFFNDASISSGKMDIVVSLYRTHDANKDGTGDWYTKEEATLMNVFYTFPDDIDSAGQFFARRVTEAPEEYYYIYERMPEPYTISLDTMLLTESYSYVVVVKNLSKIRGRIVTSIEGCKDGIADLLMFNNQRLHDLVDTDGKGKYFFTYRLGETAPDNGLSPAENAIIMADQELALLPLNMSLFNDLNGSQNDYMNKTSIHVSASIEIEQVLSEKE